MNLIIHYNINRNKYSQDQKIMLNKENANAKTTQCKFSSENYAMITQNIKRKL